MRQMKKVVTKAQLRTKEPVAFLNTDPKNRGLFIGTRKGEAVSALGYIGKVCEQTSGTSILDYAVWLDLSFPHVIGIFGTRGSGKSFDMGVLIECIQGMKSVLVGEAPSSSTVIFDLQNQFWTLALAPDSKLPEDSSHLEILKMWGLSPTSLENCVLWMPDGLESPLPEVHTWKIDPDYLNDSDWLALLELERYSPMGQALLALLSVSTDKEPSALANRAIHSPSLSSFQQSTIDGLRWRLEALLESRLVGKPGITIDEFLIPQRISIVLLRDLPDSLKSLSVGVITRLLSNKMTEYHQRRRVARRYGKEAEKQEIPDRLWVILDEAHLVVPTEGRTAASVPIVDYVKRGRDSGLSLIFATQQPSAVDRRLMSQVDVTLTHALGFESDLQAAIGRMPTRNILSYEIKSTRLSSMGDVIRCLDPGEAVVADASNSRAFLMRVRPRLSAHGGNTTT